MFRYQTDSHAQPYTLIYPHASQLHMHSHTGTWSYTHAHTWKPPNTHTSYHQAHTYRHGYASSYGNTVAYRLLWVVSTNSNLSMHTHPYLDTCPQINSQIQSYTLMFSHTSAHTDLHVHTQTHTYIHVVTSEIQS